MQRAEQQIARIHERYAPLDERTAELLANIRLACERRPGESFNRANERQVEEFIAWLVSAFPGRTHAVSRPGGDPRVWDAARGRRDGPAVVIERQRLSAWTEGTTSVVFGE